MKAYSFLLFFTIALFVLPEVKAQEVKASDTIRISVPEKHSPKKATLLSAAVPGLGQAYNKKYWKIPLVYAAIGVPLYFALDQRDQFEEFKQAYLYRVDEDPSTVDTKYDDVYTDENLENLIDYHRRNRDLLFVLTGVAYMLNIVDAAVDAHLYYFDVSDDLSASIKPNVQFIAPRRLEPIPSITLTLKFGKKASHH
ncbi:MAG: DUF5683 domain-containing protein [Vicingaceae bacterium]